jgi:hypothetical protein
LPSGVTATPGKPGSTVMSAGFLVRVFTSIVDTVPLMPFVTTTIGRHGARPADADTPSGTTPTSAPANPSAITPRTQRTRTTDTGEVQRSCAESTDLKETDNVGRGHGLVEAFELELAHRLHLHEMLDCRRGSGLDHDLSARGGVA